MTKTIFTLLAAVVAFQGIAIETRKKRPEISTTIDFLDYTYYDQLQYKEYYPLEAWERRIREIAESGIKKINIRVNATGLTLYPTRLSKKYGADGDYLWDCPTWQAKRCASTINRYDPLKETIRLGHKYGMQVWCWESLFDNSQLEKTPPSAKEDPVAAGKSFKYPLMDPWFRKHPEGYAMLDPKKDFSDHELEKINREAMAFPIEKIRVVNRVKNRPPVRFSGNDLEILISDDNKFYRLYKRNFSFKSGTTSDGRNFIDLNGLNIQCRYIKLRLKRSFHGIDAISGYTIGLNSSRGLCEVYNTRGEKIHSVWASILNSPNPHAPLIFSHFTPAALDSFGNRRQIGFIRGELKPVRWFYGITEFNVPSAMEYRIKRFRELAAYPFDGYIFNHRTHSNKCEHPENYGYNPEVREKFLRRYGKDIWKESFDKQKLFELRAEAIAEYLKHCKKEIGSRPLYITGLPQPQRSKGNLYARAFGPIPWPYHRCIAESSIDGIILLGCDRIEDIGLSKSEATKINIGVFREMAEYPKNYNFAKDLKVLRKRTDLAEVELYESMILTNNPPMLKEIKKYVESE